MNQKKYVVLRRYQKKFSLEEKKNFFDSGSQGISKYLE